jgi:glucose/arabinose dehydrogenase
MAEGFNIPLTGINYLNENLYVYTNISGFDFNYNSTFGPYGDIYIAEFGSRVKREHGDTMPYSGTGHRISKIDRNTRTVSTFAMNRTGFPASIALGGGLERPADVVFGPDGAMYVLDMGLNLRNDSTMFIPNTGVIRRIYRT